MIRFNRHEVCHLIRACEAYKEKTGSEFMWDVYDDIEKKLEAYGEEITTDFDQLCPSE